MENLAINVGDVYEHYKIKRRYIVKEVFSKEDTFDNVWVKIVQLDNEKLDFEFPRKCLLDFYNKVE